MRRRQKSTEELIATFRARAAVPPNRQNQLLVRHLQCKESLELADAVNVIPKKMNDGENDALTTPVSVTGTVEDLDRELPQTLLHFVSSHLELKNSLERAKAEMEEASKAARAEARKKSGSPITKKDPAVNSSKPAVAPEAPAPAKAEPPKAASLFDAAPEPVKSWGPDGPAAAEVRPALAVSETDEDEEILRDPASAFASRLRVSVQRVRRAGCAENAPKSVPCSEKRLGHLPLLRPSGLGIEPYFLSGQPQFQQIRP